jgi:hypothetical protein
MIGRMEEWKDGRMEGWMDFYSFNLPTHIRR